MQNYQSDSGIGVGIFRFYCQKIVDGKKFHRAVLAVIIVNSVIVGLQTIPSIKAAVGPTLDQIDTVIVWLFVAELLLRFAAQGFRMFRSPWSVFDTIVVAISVIPATDGLSVLRTLRILRVLRTVSGGAPIAPGRGWPFEFVAGAGRGHHSVVPDLLCLGCDRDGTVRRGIP